MSSKRSRVWKVTSGDIVNSAGDHLPRTGHFTDHEQPSTGYSLTVEHNPDLHNTTQPHTHTVILDHGPANTLVTMQWPSAQHGAEKAHLGSGVYAQPPSAVLRALIEAHHENHAWMPLLDRLAEEYPEHWDAPVQQHLKFRAS